MIEILVGLGGFALLGAGFALSTELAECSRLSRDGRYAEVAKRLKWHTFHPCPPWARNGYCLRLNLLAHALTLSGDKKSAEKICKRLVKLEGVAEGLRGQVFQRLAEIAGGRDGCAYQSQADEIWDSHLAELERLGLWEDLAYYFWGTQDPGKAAYCFDRSLEKDWRAESLYLRYLCHVEAGLEDDQALLAMAEVAYQYSQISHHEEHLLFSIALHQSRAENYERAHSLFQKNLERSRHLGIRNLCYRHSIYNLRAMRRYKEAEDEKDRWFSNLGKEGLLVKLGFLHDDGEFETGLSMLEAHLESREPNLRYAIGTFLLELGRAEDALPHLRASADLPFEPSSTVQLARAYMLLLDRKNALRQIEAVEQREWSQAAQYRSTIAFIWDGDPQEGQLHFRSGELNLSQATYYGEFESQLESLPGRLHKQMAHAPKEYRLATVAFHLATIHHWMKSHSDALKAYQEAQSLYTDSPYPRALCRLFSLECRAYLGESVHAEFKVLTTELIRDFPQARSLHVHFDNVESELHFARGDYPTFLSLCESYLQKEPRKFMQAAQLRLRAEAFLALGDRESAKREFGQICTLAPESFLARWAQEQRASLS